LSRHPPPPPRGGRARRPPARNRRAAHRSGCHRLDVWRAASRGGGTGVGASGPGGEAHSLARAGACRTRVRGDAWRRVQAGEGRLRLRNGAADAFAWGPGSKRVVYAGTVSGGRYGSTLVYVSRDAGLTWRVFGRKLRSTGGVMSLEAMLGGDLLAGTMGNAA